MSWGYPDGCTQADHDRAFNELGPSPAELAAEFSLHGWRCRKLIAESILSESAVTRIPMIGMADAVACRALPAQTGYDIFFHTEYAS